MSDNPSNYELDDELLSAYLDGELRADERAAVEARLASDPVAQQLLHELRSVSESVQALPTETLGRNLSNDVIRRAQESAPTRERALSRKGAPEPASPRSIDTMPTVRIFGSKRAWIWASMALAAGLLIMIVQSGDEPAKKLPPLAARNHEPAPSRPTDERGQPAPRERSLSASPKRQSPPPATIASDNLVRENVEAAGTAIPSVPTSGEPTSGPPTGLTSDGAATGTPLAAASPAPEMRIERDSSNTATATSSPLATDKLALPSEPSGRIDAAGASGIAAEKQKRVWSLKSAPESFLVVRVIAKPEALKNGSFERVLAENKIEFVPEPENKQSVSISGGRRVVHAKSEIASKTQLNDTEIHAAEPQMVLVEAPPAAVESCLAELNKNTSDFLSIDVSDQPQSHDRVDAKSPKAKNLKADPTNLSRFSRGATPLVEKEKIDLQKYYYDFNQPSDAPANLPSRAGGFGGEATPRFGTEQDAISDEKWRYNGQPQSNIRRARSLDSWYGDNRAANEPQSQSRAAGAQVGEEVTRQPVAPRKRDQSLKDKANKNDNVKVLFVITPDKTPAPTAPPATPPK
jgi:hypothetical protein